jgi:uncharacterized surface protein with fasciclin (FAS1) repeats
MNHHSIQSLAGHTGFRIVLLVLASMVFNTCVEEPQIWKVASQQQVIGDYITSHPEQFSEFGKLMESTGMEALLNTRGPFTLFLPTDEAMLEYYTYKNANSLADFTDSLLEELILYHTVGAEIGANDIGLGTLRETNAIGDFLVTEFDGSDIIVHKHSRIIDRDIRAANGYIHVIDRVIDPVTKDIYSVISSDPSYRIFSEGLSLTGLKDTLQLISFPYGKSMARTRFTVLAVADTIYQRYGIHDVQELIGWCGANPDSITFLENPFYRYMEYHCLNNTYYLSDLETGIYPILSRDNNISFTIDTDYKINLDSKTDLYTGFNIPASNTPAKNGALHSVNDILPVIVPEPASIIFETTDFFDLKHGDYYLHYYKRFFDGENTFANIKWKGDYLLYYYKAIQPENINYDCLSMLGWWSVSVTFPKVMKGKYEVFIYQPGWQDVTDCIAYLDGEGTNYTYTGPYGTGSGGLQKIADAEFTTTTEHTITLRNIVFGMLFWDYVLFQPAR